jgi:Vitamin K-dependent gamma-carboxylase
MAKLVALCILLSLEWKSFPDPFLPFVPAFGHLAIGPLFRWSLKVIFLTAAAALLFNRHVRVACLAIAFVFLAGVFSSRIYFENNRLFVGCLFFLAGLTETNGTPWLLRCQVVLLYLAAGMNKLFDAGWRSGLFFATWGGHFIKEQLYFSAAAMLPDLAMAKIFSWSAIATELSLPIALLHPKSRTIAIWIGILFHTSMLFLTGRTFGLFYFAVLASYLSFVEWPRSEVNVQIYFVIVAMLAVPEPEAFPYRRWLAMALCVVFAIVIASRRLVNRGLHELHPYNPCNP